MDDIRLKNVRTDFQKRLKRFEMHRIRGFSMTKEQNMQLKKELREDFNELLESVSLCAAHCKE